MTIYGPPPEKRGSALATFNVEGIHATDLSTFLDFEGRISASCDLFLLVLSPVDVARPPASMALPSTGRGQGVWFSVQVQGLQCGRGTIAHSRCTTTWASMPQPEPRRTSTTRWCVCDALSRNRLGTAIDFAAVCLGLPLVYGLCARPLHGSMLAALAADKCH